MSNNFGDAFKISIFGESHGKAIGAIIDGLPAGFKLDLEQIQQQLDRRRPGYDKTATQRKETDQIDILSGVVDKIATGSPICGIINNTNTKSADYKNIQSIARPSHADFVAYKKYSGANDVRGGGHFSGRITAPIVFAGAIAKQYLFYKGIAVGAHISSVGTIADDKFDAVNIKEKDLLDLNASAFPLINSSLEMPIRDYIEKARMNLDSVGGTIECAAVGLPVGLGEPFFDSVESKIAQIAFSIPAIKGIEFGAGFDIAQMYGSKANDEMYFGENGNFATFTNNNGGINGGITNSMPLVFKVAIKPTPSIGKEQRSIDYKNNENVNFSIAGRHDPCIVLRAVPVIESCLCIALCDLYLMNVRGK